MATPNWLLVVPDLDDAEVLRAVGSKAVATIENLCPDAELPRGTGAEVLCVGIAQRITGDLRKAGGKRVWGTHVALDHLSVATHSKHVAEQTGNDVVGHELDEFVHALEDATFALDDVTPTGHPDSPSSARRLQVVSLADLASLPDRPFFVDRLPHDDSLVALIGVAAPPGRLVR